MCQCIAGGAGTPEMPGSASRAHVPDGIVLENLDKCILVKDSQYFSVFQ